MLEESLSGIGKMLDIAIGWIPWWLWIIIAIVIIYFISYNNG